MFCRVNSPALTGLFSMYALKREISRENERKAEMTLGSAGLAARATYTRTVNADSVRVTGR
jgi:hypothetical protein